MRCVGFFLNEVRDFDDVWIPMADDVRLAARIWMPKDAEADPAPAILEYIPYRKRDHTRPRDDLNHPYFAGNSCPPDPAMAGDNWRALWLERLKCSGLWLDQWTRCPHRDEFWKHASVCEDYSRIRCPIFAVSGWADGLRERA